MAGMPWFRMFHEARTDRKLAALTAEQHRVWFNLMCLASEQEENRGIIPPMTDYLLAVEVAGGDDALLSETVALLVKLQIVRVDETGITFVNFLKRQYDKPSDQPSETARRKAEQRARERDAQPTDNGVTPMSRPVTPGHALEEDIEKTQREKQTQKETVENDPQPPAPAAKPLAPVKVAVSPAAKGLVAALCEELGADESTLTPSYRKKQTVIASRIVKDGADEDDVRRLLRYLRSQHWRTAPIDLHTVESEMGKWRLAGCPVAEAAPARASPAAAGRGSVATIMAGLASYGEQHGPHGTATGNGRTPGDLAASGTGHGDDARPVRYLPPGAREPDG